MGVKLGLSHRSRVFENRELRRMFGVNGEGETGGWRKLHKEKTISCTLHRILLRRSNQGG
jgi:hypothetical protein